MGPQQYGFRNGCWYGVDREAGFGYAYKPADVINQMNDGAKEAYFRQVCDTVNEWKREAANKVGALTADGKLKLFGTDDMWWDADEMLESMPLTHNTGNSVQVLRYRICSYVRLDLGCDDKVLGLIKWLAEHKRLDDIISVLDSRKRG